MENRVAKNTLLLYFRMLLTMCISIYTSKVVLQALGIEDYGIYSVVGGVVALLNFFTNALSSSFQRFFCLEINKGDARNFSNVIGTALSVIVIWSIVVLVIAESLGLWMVNCMLVIPFEKMQTANIIYQFSIASFIVCLFQSIYNALIISFERMKLFAYISIFEALCKLGIAFSITLFGKDYLFNYGCLMFVSTTTIFSVYAIYCLHYFNVCRVGLKYNINVLKDIFNFSCWTLIGTFSNVIQTNGANILLNIFFGPAINAARAVSFQIYTAVGTFTRGFQTAFSPTMIKTYGLNKTNEVTRQLLTASKLSLYLMVLLSVPFFINIDFILNLWLGKSNVPAYTNSFVRLIIIIGLIEVLSPPIVNLIYANGKIKNFQIAISVVTILVIPVSYVSLECGYSPLSVYLITILITSIAHVIRLYFLRKVLSFQLHEYCLKIVFPLAISIFTLFILSFSFQDISEKGLLCYILTVCGVELLTVTTIYLVGIESYERYMIKKLIRCVKPFK